MVPEYNKMIRVHDIVVKQNDGHLDKRMLENAVSALISYGAQRGLLSVPERTEYGDGHYSFAVRVLDQDGIRIEYTVGCTSRSKIQRHSVDWADIRVSSPHTSVDEAETKLTTIIKKACDDTVRYRKMLADFNSGIRRTG